MPAELEGLDAPVLETEVDDQTQTDPIEGEGAEDQTEAEPEQITETKGDERTLPRWIRDLKGTRPEDFRAARDHFFQQKELEGKLKDFDLDGTKSWLEEKGGREALDATFTELEGKAAELDGINEAIASGNPEIIREIAELHPESFGKLAEATLNQWSQTNPEDYTRVMSGIMASTLQSSGVPVFLERMAMYLEVGKTEQVAQAINQMLEWSKSFGQAAAKQPTAANASKGTDEAAQRLAQREKELYSRDYLGKLESQRKPMIEDALKDYVALRPESAGLKDRAIKAAIESMEQTLGKDQQFVRSVQAFHAKGDADGALRLVKSREGKIVADVIKSVGEEFFGKLGPKVVQKTATTQRTQQRQQRTQTPLKPKDKFAEIFASA